MTIGNRPICDVPLKVSSAKQSRRGASFLRLLVAGLLAYVVIIASVLLASNLPEGLMIPGAFLSVVVAIFVAYAVFDRDSLRRFILGHDRYIAIELEKGRATSVTYEATDALSFEDVKTGCVAHFLALSDGRVMCLYGQYLYAFEPGSDPDDEEDQEERQFPSTEFTVVRRVRDDEVLDLEPGSQVLEPEILDGPKEYSLLNAMGFSLENGEIVENVGLGDVKRAIESNRSRGL